MIKDFLKKIIPKIFLDWYYQLFPLLGAIFYRFPSRKLIVIGITGTNGKSTVVQLTTDILKEAGFKVASISSVRFQIDDKEWQNKLKMTMPGRLKLQRFLRQALNKGCQHAVLEVTSEGIKQFRHKFINFDVAVLTNLTKEHIEAHGGFENYRQAKGELFKTAGLKTSIVNLDDKSAEYFLQFEADERWGYRIKRKTQNVKRKATAKNLKVIEAEDVELYENGSSFKIQKQPYGESLASLGPAKFKIHLLGEFNVYNSLAAVCIGLSQGVGLEIIKKALEKIEGIPGRIELVISRPFKVFVDYAHTPDALESVYKTLCNYTLPITSYPSAAPERGGGRRARPQRFASPHDSRQRVWRAQRCGQGKLICVLGSCGGGRDKWRRPELGRLASRYCDRIVLTNEDPYDENPVQIIEDIEKGVSKETDYEKILERREAIRRALVLAKPGDTVIITGKGSEPWMCVAGGKKIHWDDRQIVREEL